MLTDVYNLFVMYKNICVGNRLVKYDGHGYKTGYNSMLTHVDTVSLDEFFVCSLKWVKYDIVFNVFQRREFCIMPNVCCV